MKYLVALSSILLVLLCSCGNDQVNSSPDFEIILKTTGQNRQELEKVINHYRKKDRLKLDALHFLLSNIEGKLACSSGFIPIYRKSFDSMNIIYNAGGTDLGHHWDSIAKLLPVDNFSEMDTILDKDKIRADLLISNIDASFDAWKYKWARSLTFKDFCEYILPYKVLNEQPENWKKAIQMQFKSVTDTITETSPISVCRTVNGFLKKSFYIGSLSPRWNLNYSDLSKVRTGTCDLATQYTTYTMRALGIPVVMDYTPYWANKDNGHQWNALIEDGKPRFFVGTESDIGRNKIEFTSTSALKRKRAKVFRHTYSIQQGSILNYAREELVPKVFRSWTMADVTSAYVPVSEIEIKVERKVPDPRIAYLCVFNNRTWKPIFWSKINIFKKAVFKDMGRDILYLPMSYEDGELYPVGKPILVDTAGNQDPITPDLMNLQKMSITKKHPEKGNAIEKGDTYELFYWRNAWVSVGRQTAKDSFLVFQKVPSNALYWLRNLSKGKQERIFTYMDGKQIWW